MLMWMKDIDQHTKGLPESMDKAPLFTKRPLFLLAVLFRSTESHSDL
jgi:hypothetical protein